MINEILKGYEDAVSDGDFIHRLDGISSVDLFAPVIEHFPQQPFHVLDIGAGTGRDAAWLASLSHSPLIAEHRLFHHLKMYLKKLSAGKQLSRKTPS